MWVVVGKITKQKNRRTETDFLYKKGTKKKKNNGRVGKEKGKNKREFKEGSK